MNMRTMKTMNMIMGTTWLYLASVLRRQSRHYFKQTASTVSGLYHGLFRTPYET